MRLAISLLQMPLVKLKDYVKQQVEENPLLEIENKEMPPKEVESDLNYSSNEDEPHPFLKERGEKEKHNYRESLITKDFGVGVNTEKAVRLIPDAILKRNNDKYRVKLEEIFC